MVHICQSDVGKRIDIKYTPTSRRITGKIITVTDRMVAVLTERNSKLYIPFSQLEKYSYKIH
ncbi:MAG: hypothetical protein IJH12_09945 [Clostridia bacterium]|nr:hypothetical protein [Clostridia bacterium]